MNLPSIRIGSPELFEQTVLRATLGGAFAGLGMSAVVSFLPGGFAMFVPPLLGVAFATLSRELLRPDLRTWLTAILMLGPLVVVSHQARSRWRASLRCSRGRC